MYNYTVFLGPPTLPELYKLKIHERVGMKYKTLGTMLLKDDGHKVENLMAENFYVPSGIVGGILQQWLRSMPTPVTWDNLINVLEHCELTDIVKDVEEYVKTLKKN